MPRARNRLSLPTVSRFGRLIDRWKKPTIDEDATTTLVRRTRSSRYLSSVPGCLPLSSPSLPGTAESIHSARSVHSSSSLVDIHDALYPTTPTSPSYPSTPAPCSTPPIIKYPTPILAHSNSSNSLGKLLRWSDGTPPPNPSSAPAELHDSLSPTSSLEVKFPLRPSSLINDLHEYDEDAARALAHKRHSSMPLPSAPSLSTPPNSSPNTPCGSPAPAGVWLCSRPRPSHDGCMRDVIQRPVITTSVVRSSSDLSETDCIAAHSLRPSHALKPRGGSANSATTMCSLRRSIDTTAVKSEPGRLGAADPPQHLFPSNAISVSPASSVESHEIHDVVGGEIKLGTC